MTIERVSEEEITNWTPIRIEGPLPNTVALALIEAIGKIWPEATIQGNADRRLALDMRVPPTNPEDLDQEFANQIRKNADEEHEDVDFLGFRDGYVAFTPPEELCLHLGDVAHAIFTAHEPDAINHVEWTVLTGKEPDDPSYVLSISKSKKQTPLAMRKAAEAEVERLTKLLDDHGIAH